MHDQSSNHSRNTPLYQWVYTFVFDFFHKDIHEKPKMSDKQPLLKKSNKLSRDDDEDDNKNNKRISTGT